MLGLGIEARCLSLVLVLLSVRSYESNTEEGTVVKETLLVLKVWP